MPSPKSLFLAPDPPHILPLNVPDAHPASRIPKRCCRLLVLLVVAVSALVWLFPQHVDTDPRAQLIQDYAANHSLPPLYEAYHDYERHLPQHNLSLPFPEGRDAKFFWVPNHVIASGWGNAMQELLLNALLAYETDRAFVFDNYTWARDGSEYSEFNGRLIPSRIPLSAIISGPVIGAPFGPGEHVPRAVHREYFERVCPTPTILNSDHVVGAELRFGNHVPASRIFDIWVEKLNAINDPCVQVELGSSQLFEIWLFGSARILSMWPRLSKSPILGQFSWSPLVLEAFAHNAHLFGATTTSFRFLPSYLRPSSPPPTPTELHNVAPLLPAPKVDPIPGLLVLHVRRGDFVEHCANLAGWESDWNGFNKFAALPDKFRVPHNDGEVTEANMQYYLERCFPSIERMMARVREVLRDQQKTYGDTRALKRVYIMTNGEEAWLNALKAALAGVHAWDSVTSSRDLELSWEAKPVAQAMDMLVGQRAQVFIGNGFSSLTSNIVMLRMLRELPPEDTRMW